MGAMLPTSFPAWERGWGIPEAVCLKKSIFVLVVNRLVLNVSLN